MADVAKANGVRWLSDCREAAGAPLHAPRAPRRVRRVLDHLPACPSSTQVTTPIGPQRSAGKYRPNPQLRALDKTLVARDEMPYAIASVIEGKVGRRVPARAAHTGCRHEGEIPGLSPLAPAARLRSAGPLPVLVYGNFWARGRYQRGSWDPDPGRT
jgi:hypothetical protein